MKLGLNFKRKLDETFFNQLAGVNMKNYMNNGIRLRNTNWFSAKTTAYFEYDDTLNFGKDEQSWKVIQQKKLKKRLNAADRNIRLRLGVNHHQAKWEGMMSNERNRNNFAQKVFALVRDYDFDGADFDFEWCYNNHNNSCNQNYSKNYRRYRRKSPTKLSRYPYTRCPTKSLKRPLLP